MNYKLLPPAVQELKQAAKYYEEIVSVMHLHRRPESWRKNLPGV